MPPRLAPCPGCGTSRRDPVKGGNVDGSQRQLTNAVWHDPRTDGNLIRVYLKHIRGKLERDQANPRYFVTDTGLGYRFIPATE